MSKKNGKDFYSVPFLKKVGWLFYGFLEKIGLMKRITEKPLRVFVKKYGNNSKTLNIGAGKTTFEEFFPNQTTLDVEVRPDMQIDIIADAHDLSEIQNNSYETILCTEVLEHLHTPHLAISEMYRILKPGGLLLLTTRFIFPLHSSPVDYYRFTKYGLRHLLKDFEILELSEDSNTMETIAILCQRIAIQTKTLWFKPFKLIWFILASIMRYLNFLITSEYSDGRYNVKEKNILASGYLVAAIKNNDN